jgi:hypothetical protein
MAARYETTSGAATRQTTTAKAAENDISQTAANTNKAVLPPRHNNPTPRSIKNVRAMPITTSRERIRRHFVHSPDNPDTEAMVGGSRWKEKTFNSDGVDTTKRNHGGDDEKKL